MQSSEVCLSVFLAALRSSSALLVCSYGSGGQEKLFPNGGRNTGNRDFNGSTTSSKRQRDVARHHQKRMKSLLEYKNKDRLEAMKNKKRG